ncbi:adenosylmethionine-8-amino-7-oxononanoate transaminase isoform X2 [Wolffia australiana]
MAISYNLCRRHGYSISRLLSRRGISKSSATSSDGAEVDLSHPAFMIWGANTGVGKTLVSAGLAASVLCDSQSSAKPIPSQFLYLKPVQTGFPRDSDSRFVHRKVSELFRNWNSSHIGLQASNHVLKVSVPASEEMPGVEVLEGASDGLRDLWFYEERRVGGLDYDGDDSKLLCKTMYAWKEPISPHLAVEKEMGAVQDSVLLQSLKELIASAFSKTIDRTWCVIETAGGVASPGPSGVLQCDLYRPFRLPGILVGDGRLGGISCTVSSYETLKLRGYDIVAIILEDHGLSNDNALLSYLRHKIPVLVMPHIPCDPSDDLMRWFFESRNVFICLQNLMYAAYMKRVDRLRHMASKAGEILWWPFTQHKLVSSETVTVIDSRLGEHFSVHKVVGVHDFIVPQFDACASWWTQGPDATLQIELARETGYATSRYGHVMFPENVHEPALRCAELMLEGVGKGWASRVFFSDNGSTAIEIALKMGFRKFLADSGIHDTIAKNMDFRVLALRGSYHGDTLGAMEAQAPSTYTGFLQQPWYSGRGVFLDPPTAYISDGRWKISIPETLMCGREKTNDMSGADFSSVKDLFSFQRGSSVLADGYLAYISEQLTKISGGGLSTVLGALIIEPVIHGAGGMQMVDPVFQRILVRECQARKIPVIFDEVFTGFWRLGRESAAELLGCQPDIACYAKLLTGGVVPLAATLAREEIFEAFYRDSKEEALLHGHSYSGHPVGCSVATKAIRWFKDTSTNPNLCVDGNGLKELWDEGLVQQVSSHFAVRRVVALGTLCAIELRAEGSDAGYASLYASSLIRILREDGVYMRSLGNVIYLMCGPCTSPDVCRAQLLKVYRALDRFIASQ